MLETFRATAFAATAVAAMTTGAATANSQEVTLRLHTLLPTVAAPPKTFLIPWTKTVGKASKGRLNVKFFPSMQLGGKPPQLVDQA